jgi:hypothetical protein
MGFLSSVAGLQRFREAPRLMRAERRHRELARRKEAGRSASARRYPQVIDGLRSPRRSCSLGRTAACGILPYRASHWRLPRHLMFAELVVGHLVHATPFHILLLGLFQGALVLVRRVCRRGCIYGSCAASIPAAVAHSARRLYECRFYAARNEQRHRLRASDATSQSSPSSDALNVCPNTRLLPPHCDTGGGPSATPRAHARDRPRDT